MLPVMNALCQLARPASWLLRLHPLALALITLTLPLAQAQTAVKESAPLEIRPAPLFSGPLLALDRDAATIKEGELLQLAMDASRQADSLEAAGLLEAFLEEHAGSAWEPGLRACLGGFWMQEGAYSAALHHWSIAWEQTKGLRSGPGKRIADYALAQWTRLLVGLGRLDELAAIYEAVGNRHLDAGPLEQTYLRTKEFWVRLHWEPSASYRGGWAVANHVVETERERGLDPPSRTPSTMKPTCSKAAHCG